MTAYRYNLDAQQAKHFAGLKSGDEFVIVVPLKKQPPEGWACVGIFDKYSGMDYNLNEIDVVENCVVFQNLQNDDSLAIPLPFPIGSRVGLREAWRKSYGYYFYKVDMGSFSNCIGWNSAQCMPVDAINQRWNWGVVTDARVCRVQETLPIQMIHQSASREPCITNGFYDKDWFIYRYGLDAWLKNPYVEVVTGKKE